jgi:hypothetical protein
MVTDSIKQLAGFLNTAVASFHFFICDAFPDGLLSKLYVRQCPELASVWFRDIDDFGGKKKLKKYPKRVMYAVYLFFW